MSSTPKAHKLYREAVRGNLKPYFPNWLPGDPQQLGNYGTMRDGVFTSLGNIKDDFGNDFRVVIDPHTDNHQFDAGGSVSVDFGASAGVGEVAKGSLKLGFEKEESVFFQALDARANRIANKREVGDRILKGFRDGTIGWKRKYVLITDIVTAGRTVAAVSGSKGATLELHAEGDVPAGQIPVDATIGLSVQSSSKVGYIVNGQGMDILLGLSKIKRRFLKPAEFGVPKSMLHPVEGVGSTAPDKSSG